MMLQSHTLLKDNEQVVAALINIEPYIQTIISKLPQQHEKDVESFWVTTLQPSLRQFNADSLSFASKFCTFYPYFSEWTEALSNPEISSKFVQGVASLLDALEKNIANIQKTLKLVDEWMALVSRGFAHFSNVLTVAKMSFEGDIRTLEKLLSEICEISSNMGKNLSAIAARIASEPCGGIVISVGKLVEINSEVIPVGGIASVGCSLSTGAATKKFMAGLKTKAELTERLAILSLDSARAFSTVSLFSNLEETTKLVQGAVNQLLQTWKTVQTDFMAAHEKLADLASESQLQGDITTSYNSWKSVEESAKRIQDQLSDIPVQIDLALPYAIAAAPATVLIKNPIIRDVTTVAVRERLNNDETAGDLVRALKDLIDQINIDMLYFVTAVDTHGLKEDALVIVEEVNLLTPKLAKLGDTYPDRLEVLIRKNPLDTVAIQNIFKEILIFLEPIQRDTDRLLILSHNLYVKASSAAAASQTELDALRAEIAAGREEITDLINQIQAIQAHILALEQMKAILCVGVMIIFCPITSLIVDLVSDRNAKIAEMEAAMVNLSDKIYEYADLHARSLWVLVYREQSLRLTNHTNRLIQILQILVTKFRDIAFAASPEIIEAWAKEQAQDLINALRSLRGLTRALEINFTSFNTRARPSQAFQALVDRRFSKFIKPQIRTNPPTILEALSSISAAHFCTYAATTALIQNTPQNSTIEASQQFELARTNVRQIQTDFFAGVIEIFRHISALSNIVVCLLQKATSKIETRIRNQIERTTESIKGLLNDLNTLFGLAYRARSRLIVLRCSTFGPQTPDITKITNQIESADKDIVDENFRRACQISNTILKGVTPEIQLSNGPLRSIHSTLALEKPELSIQQQKFDSHRVQFSELSLMNPNFTALYTISSQLNGIVKTTLTTVGHVENLITSLENEKINLQDPKFALQHWQTIHTGVQQFLRFYSCFSL
eukprot:Phypoly_transcript_01777.p1 GENE.Phypoly_transcript_01777~~Phypoly_transcript_01777.p1  ORF type:complete len:956 (+),score=126.38 Phypoly_transcript_01777:174-3041(+)